VVIEDKGAVPRGLKPFRLGTAAVRLKPHPFKPRSESREQPRPMAND
jgi:hypothetical protein